jgi:alpha-1,6-mannosyltransferase
VPALELLGRARSALAYGSLTAVVGSGAAIALLSADRHSVIVPGGGRGLPGWLVGPLSGVTGMHLTLIRFYLLVGAMSAAYVAVIALGGQLRARWLLGAVAVLHLAFLLAPPILSTDVFNYIDYARLGALHGLDPYSHGPAAAPHDPVFTYTAWRHVGSAYGPLFTIASYPLAYLGVAGALWSFKVLAAAASLGCVALVWRIARQLGRRPEVAAAVFGLNPLVLVWTVGGAHNDLLMLMLMLAGVSLALGTRKALGGATLVAATAIKAIAGVAIPLMLLGTQRRWRAAAGAAGAAAALVVLYAGAAVAFPGHAFGFIDVLNQQRSLVGYNSVPKELAQLFGLPDVTPGVRTAAIVVLFAALVFIAVRVWRGANWVTACGWALVALVVTTSWQLAWYTIWPLAFAAVSRDRRLLVATLGLQAFWIVNHVPGFTGFTG